jgi:long-chain acyl-CoA synthetase
VLVVPNWEQLEKWAKQRNLMWTNRAGLLAMPEVRAKMEQEVLGRTAHLARYEQPKKVALLEHEFTVERGELTPTLKVKRRVVDRMYASVIDALYQDESEPAGPAG